MIVTKSPGLASVSFKALYDVTPAHNIAVGGEKEMKWEQYELRRSYWYYKKFQRKRGMNVLCADEKNIFNTVIVSDKLKVEAKFLKIGEDKKYVSAV